MDGSGFKSYCSFYQISNKTLTNPFQLFNTAKVGMQMIGLVTFFNLPMDGAIITVSGGFIRNPKQTEASGYGPDN